MLVEWGANDVSSCKEIPRYSFVFDRVDNLITFVPGLSCLYQARLARASLFKQKRVGIHKRHFMILKFRTMRTDTPKETPTHLLTDPDKWITRVGRILRKTSLDELPQLINIIKGDMSIVGPRPALWNQYDLIAERDKYGANNIRPGLTGWAQINGRDELPIKVKARLDGEYAKRIGFGLDTRCIIGTFFSVLKADGVVEGGKVQQTENSAVKEIVTR